jgi:hypothetical protein
MAAGLGTRTQPDENSADQNTAGANSPSANSPAENSPGENSAFENGAFENGARENSADANGSERGSLPPTVSRLIRRQRAFLAITTTAAMLSVIGLFASTLVRSPAQVNADSAPPPASVLTAPVVREILKQTVVVRGRVTAGGFVVATPTSAQGANALIVTQTPKKVGDPVRPGDVLIQVSGRPVIALPGGTPAYRDLKPGDRGNDVAELRAALRSLGYSDGDPNGYFGADTKAALTRMYQALGYDPASTGGAGDAGDQAALTTARAAVTTAQRAVATAQAALTAARGASPPDPGAVASAQQSLGFAQQDLVSAQNAQTELIATTGVELPMSEFVFLPSFPASVAAISGAVGATVSAPLVTVDTGTPVITTTLQQGDATVVRAGMPVGIDADLRNQSATGTVTAIGPYSAGSSGAGSAGGSGGAGGPDPAAAGPSAAVASPPGTTQATPGYPLTVTPTKTLTNDWIGQDVRLTVTTGSTASAVLVVPVAAIAVGADGTTTVTVLASDTIQRRVAVSAGVDSNGLVQITPASAGSLRAGDLVVTGE